VTPAAPATKNKTEDQDAELVSACRRGDRRAQYQLYSRHKDWVYNVAFRMANNRQEAEDITQKVFIRVFSKIDSFRGDSLFSSWLYRLTANICINHFRSEKSRKEKVSNELSKDENQSTEVFKSGEEKFSLRPFLEKAISSLPEGYRLVFVLHHIEGYGHQEIGKMLNITEGTSKSQLHKARKELKRMLAPYLALEGVL
jgi:RNA polymerase sigma-70 factor (ECF subfamily)